MFKKSLIFISLISVISTAFAVEKRILANGLTLITEEDHTKDIVAICCYVDGGGRTETLKLSGLSHYFEHLIFRGGTSKQEELETRRKFASLGTFYGYTFEDGTCYYIIVPKDNLPEALERYSDVLLNLELNEKKVEVERGIVLEEFSQSYFDIPSGMAYYNLFQTAFTRHPYGQTVIGDTSVVRNADLGTFRKFYSERYTPDHLVMSAVGDFDTGYLVQEIERTFGKFLANGINFELGKSEPPQDHYKWSVYKMPITSAHFNIGFHIPAYSAPEFPALEVLNSALAGDQNAYLCRQLVQVQPWFNYLYSYVMSTKEPGMLVIGGELETAKMDSAFNALFEELSKIASSGLPPEDIESARGRLICSDNNKHESFFQRAESYCYYDLCSDLSLEPLYPQRISSVTNSDILSVFSRFIIPNNLTISLVVPENSGELNIAGWVEHFQPVVIPPPSETAKLPPAEAFILNNGVTLLLQPDISVRTVSMEIFLRGGQWAEAKDKAGIADFTGRVLAKGPTGMTTEDFSRTLGEMGASFTAWTEEDYFRAELNASAEVFSQAVDLAGNALLHPGFRDDDINAVRREKLAEIKGLPDQTYDYVHQEINSLLYKRNPYGKPIIGTEKSVSAITADDLKSFYGESFIGRNLIIALAGNFEKNTTYELLNEMFSNLEAGMQFSYKPQEERLPSKPEIKIIDKERAQTTYDMAWVTASTNSEDYLPLTLAMRMLSSRMFFRFVYQEGICYRMWTRCAETIAPSKFYFETGISPSNFNFSQTEVLKELKSFLKEPITDEMLSDAKKESITKTKLGTETPSALASALGKYYLLGYGPDYLYRYPHLINKITVEEVERVARKYLDPDKFTMVVVGKVK